MITTDLRTSGWERNEMDKIDNRILLTNIQRFSLHDGPGIRTTVFLKGCSLRCPWCSNPENLISEPQIYMKDGVEGVYGKYMTPDELVKECLKDQDYYEGKLTRDQWKITKCDQIEQLPGGVTFSGGEALLQMSALVSVCECLHEAGVHIAVETALFVSPKMVELAVENIDFFYVDMKILDKNRCREVEKGNLELYLKNLDVLLLSDIPVVIRIPVIGGYTDSSENRGVVKELLRKYENYVLKVELIKEHNLSKSKYQSLGMEMQYTGVTDDMMELYKAEINDAGLFTEICRI